MHCLEKQMKIKQAILKKKKKWTVLSQMLCINACQPSFYSAWGSSAHQSNASQDASWQAPERCTLEGLLLPDWPAAELYTRLPPLCSSYPTGKRIWIVPLLLDIYPATKTQHQYFFFLLWMQKAKKGIILKLEKCLGVQHCRVRVNCKGKGEYKWNQYSKTNARL